jgi:hypothetical protein
MLTSGISAGAASDATRVAFFVVDVSLRGGAGSRSAPSLHIFLGIIGTVTSQAR